MTDRERLLDELRPVGLAMLVLLESLSPEQRAVLLLHDVFGYGHAQIASARARTTPASSRPALGDMWSSAGPASKLRASSATELTQRFFAAAEEGDLAG